MWKVNFSQQLHTCENPHLILPPYNETFWESSNRDDLPTNHDNSKLFSLALKNSKITEDWDQKPSSCNPEIQTKSGIKELLCILYFNLSFNRVTTFPRAVWDHSCGQGGGRFALTVNEANLQIFLRHHFHCQWGGKAPVIFLQSRDTFTLNRAKLLSLLQVRDVTRYVESTAETWGVLLWNVEIYDEYLKSVEL